MTGLRRRILLGTLMGAGLLAAGCQSSEKGASTEQTAQTEAQGTGVGRVAPGDSSAFGQSGPANPKLSDQSGEPGSNPALREQSGMGSNEDSSRHAETRRTDARGDSQPGIGGAGAGGSGAADAGTDAGGGSPK